MSRVVPAFALAVSGLTAAGSAVGVAPASALDNGLALTPYMGWNTYYGLGSHYNEQTIVTEAQALVKTGLAQAGYNYVWLDGGWWAGTRNADGSMAPNTTQWPDGMPWLTSYIHSLGLKAGIYTDAGSGGCGGAGQGSYGHYQQDVDTFAAWGFDAVKVDYCGGTAMGLTPSVAYGQFRDALLHNSSHRPMLLNICNPFQPGEYAPGVPTYANSVYSSYTFGPSTGNSWRTDTDVGFAHSIQWPDVLRNLDADALHPEAAGPGHWNDPDYLGPELGMTAAESQAQFTMWSMVAAPLIIGSSVSSLSPQAVSMLENPDVIAVDQDPAGVQGTVVSQQGTGQVWVKPLANGDRAVALLNRGNTPVTLTTTAGAAGLPSASRYTMHDLWAHTATETAGTIAAHVPPNSAVLYRVSAGASPDLPPSVVLSGPVITAPGTAASGPVVAPGSSATVTASLIDYGRQPLTAVQLSMAGPGHWKVSPSAPVGAPALPGDGGTAAGTWTVTAPAGTLPGPDQLTLDASYTWAGVHTETVTGAGSVTVPNAPPTGQATLSNQPWLDASSGWQYPTRDASVSGSGPITLTGQKYPTGIGVASPSQIDFYLGGQCTTLSTTAGIDDVVDNVGPQGGTATFSVLGDGHSLYQSGVVTRTNPQRITVGVAGVQVLSLVVGDGGDGTYNDRADWAGLDLSCAPTLATVPAGPWPAMVPDGSVTATATSAHPGYPASNAVDGRLTTFWHTEWSPLAPLPQSLTIDLGSTQPSSGLVYQARQDGGTSGIITGYQVAVSVDGSTWTTVATGAWPSDHSTRSAAWAPTAARYVRLIATSGVSGYASAAEVGAAVSPA